MAESDELTDPMNDHLEQNRELASDEISEAMTSASDSVVDVPVCEVLQASFSAFHPAHQAIFDQATAVRTQAAELQSTVSQSPGAHDHVIGETPDYPPV